MSMNINNTPSFAPANSGNGTILEVAVKAKELTEEKGRMALELIESAAPPVSSNNPVGNAGNNVNIKA
ncbi:cytoplasmic protein [Colwellia sp. 12G3]|uniref:cytoplasmic protein n=1 Tax=Colwellia sp. 12G3 TaxID=2058299 RepID=UPI000C3453A6|nr:cytoplasmic protein [Colwellia sp. 12G3]PKI16944.1 cytoplasmic protein [Colwellia sp. 12G3]